MGFFKKFKKKLLPTIAAIIGASIAGPAGAAIGSGLGTKVSGGSFKDALLAGVGSYAGSSLGSSIGSSFGTFGSPSLPPFLSPSNVAGPSFGSIGSMISGGLSPILGETAANSLGAGLANTSIGSALGGFYGPDLATNAFGDSQPQPSLGAAISAPAGPAPFNAKQQEQKDLPFSLSGLGGLTQNQQSTNVATQGVYGGGAGPQESDYFLNLINRRLVDEAGNVDPSFADLMPIEMSYLQQLGLGGYGTPNNLLEGISNYQYA